MMRKRYRPSIGVTGAVVLVTTTPRARFICASTPRSTISYSPNFSPHLSEPKFSIVYFRETIPLYTKQASNADVERD